jgi:hypothetical protein
MGFHDYWLHGTTVFMGLFAMMKPLGNIVSKELSIFSIKPEYHVF